MRQACRGTPRWLISMFRTTRSLQPFQLRNALMLDELGGEASGKGVLRAMRQKYGPVAFESIVGPVLQEIGRRKPIRSSRYGYTWQPGEDPLTAGIAR